MKQSNTKTLVKIPFSGFYNSIHDSVIDSALEYEAECYADSDKANDIILDALNVNHYDKIREALSKVFVEGVNELFWYEYDIKLDLEFDSLKSPKFYNYSTDEIYCYIDNDKINELVALLDNENDFIEALKDKYQSRDGFIVFDSTLQAIDNKDYSLFFSDLLCQLIDFDKIDNNEYYHDRASETVLNNLPECLYDELSKLEIDNP